MNKTAVLLLSLIFFISCNKNKKKILNNTKKDYTQYVNPLIGTSKMGHVFPGATAPFGMVQLSPQTNFELMYDKDGSYNPETYEYCAGYQYRDSIIIGFAHTNFCYRPATGKSAENQHRNTKNSLNSSYYSFRITKVYV